MQQHIPLARRSWTCARDTMAPNSLQLNVMEMTIRMFESMKLVWETIGTNGFSNYYLINSYKNMNLLYYYYCA